MHDQSGPSGPLLTLSTEDGQIYVEATENSIKIRAEGKIALDANITQQIQVLAVELLLRNIGGGSLGNQGEGPIISESRYSLSHPPAPLR